MAQLSARNLAQKSRSPEESVAQAIMHEHLQTDKAQACSVLRKTRKYGEAGFLYHIFREISRNILAEGDNFMACITEAGLLEYVACLLVPQHEIQVAHGDADGVGEFLPLHIPYKSLPCLIAIIDFGEYRSERDRVSMQELVPGLQIKKTSSDN